jgi:hypothetical protein
MLSSLAVIGGYRRYLLGTFRSVLGSYRKLLENMEGSYRKLLENMECNCYTCSSLFSSMICAPSFFFACACLFSICLAAALSCRAPLRASSYCFRRLLTSWLSFFGAFFATFSPMV